MIQRSERRKRGRPRKNPEATSYYYARAIKATTTANPIPPLATLETIRGALGIDWDALAALLRVKLRTVKYEWLAADTLPRMAIARLIKYARVNPDYLAGNSTEIFRRAPVASNRSDDDGAASIVLTAFVSALTDAEKKYVADLARALNG